MKVDSLNCFERCLRSVFGRYGSFISKHPWPFLIVPLIVAVGLGVGFKFMTSESDIEVLYVPDNAQSLYDRRTIENLYSEYGDDNLLSYQRTRLGLYGQILLQPLEGDNVLDKDIIQDALDLQKLITNITVEHGGSLYRYEDLCLSWNDNCYANGILEILKYSTTKLNDIVLTYPYYYGESGQVVFLGNELGGVSFNADNNTIEAAEIMQLTYNLRYDTIEEEERSVLWEDAFLQLVKDFMAKKSVVNRRTSHSLEREVDKASKGVVSLYSITFTVLINFSIWSCVMLDWVRSKPILACTGVISAGLAVVSAFGLMCYLNVPYINQNGSIPFLILGLGVDDMFIMIASWRQTNIYASTEDRMSKAFSEAAMSITITSVTDALAFGIGAISPFVSVRIFCYYAGLAVIFTYIYQITFFAASMVFTGRREASNRHALTFCKVKPKSESQSELYWLFCAGGSGINQINDTSIIPLRSNRSQANKNQNLKEETNETNNGVETSLNQNDGEQRKCLEKETNQFNNDVATPKNPRGGSESSKYHKEVTHQPLHDGDLNKNQDEVTDHIIMSFFKKYYGPFLTKPTVLFVVVLVYFAYFSIAVFGVFGLEYGLELTKLLPDNSYATPYYEKEPEYFNHYGPVVSIVVDEEINYWEEYNQRKLEETLQKFEEESEFFHGKSNTISWLRDYKSYLNISNIKPTEDEFYIILKDTFLHLFSHHSPDITFKTGTYTILSSRQYVSSKDVNDSTRRLQVMQKARFIAKNSGISQIAFHPAFAFYDQYTAIIPNTVQNLIIAMVAMFIISVIMIPIGSPIVALSVASIFTGVIGYMALWDIALDTISMINLILCIGFSVDFCAHITYVYFAAYNLEPRDRTINALYSLGMPIVQGACSTILGVVVLSTSNSYIFRSFFKTMFLVISFGAFHGLVFLPAFLTIIGSMLRTCKKPK